jgi:hypothetical protein
MKSHYDKPYNHDLDSFEPYYKEVSQPLPPSVPCHCPGRQPEESFDLETELEKLKLKAAEMEGMNEFPYHGHIVTQQAEDVEDQNLQLTPYTDMEYFEMISKFREANKASNDFYAAFEKDRRAM